MGWYCISDTLTLRPDTVLIGLNPSATVINLPDNTPAFQGHGEPKPVIEAPQGGTNIVTGIGVYTGRSILCRWREVDGRGKIHDERRPPARRARHAGPGRTRRLRPAGQSRRLEHPVRQPLGHQRRRRDLQRHLDAQPVCKAGMHISDTSTSGRVYAMSLEHHVSNEMIVRNASNWRFYAVQFEEEREEGPKALPLEIDRSSNLQFANTFFYRVISCFVPFPHATKVTESRDIRFRNLHCYSNSKVSFDSTIFEATAKVEVRDPEFAVLDITGGPSPRGRRQTRASSPTAPGSRNSPTAS